ncbi:MAG TPA: hypothetical protein VIC57_06540 [Candidatus Dormibacteraeota bacterium]
MRRHFVRRLPRPVRWLWFGIVALIGLELVLLALGLVYGDTLLWSALQLMSITAAPLAVGLLIVIVAGARWGGAAPPPASQDRDGEREAPAPAARPAPASETGAEVVAIQRASQAVIAAARTPEGRAAIRQGARLLRAGRAAMRPPPEKAE